MIYKIAAWVNYQVKVDGKSLRRRTPCLLGSHGGTRRGVG